MTAILEIEEEIEELKKRVNDLEIKLQKIKMETKPKRGEKEVEKILADLEKIRRKAPPGFDSVEIIRKLRGPI